MYLNFKVIGQPLIEPGNAIFTCQCISLAKLADKINNRSNARESSTNERQTKVLIKSLKNNPEAFGYKSDSITFTAEDVKVVEEDDGQKYVRAYYPDSFSYLDMMDAKTKDTDPDLVTYGMVNGGHRLRAMSYLYERQELSEDAWIRIEIWFGDNVTRDFTRQIVAARNNSLRLSKTNIDNLNGRYNVLKEMFEGDPSYEKINFRNSEDAVMDPPTLSIIAAAFSPKYIEFEDEDDEDQEDDTMIPKGFKPNLAQSAYGHKSAGVTALIDHEEVFVKNRMFYLCVFHIVSQLEAKVNAFAAKNPSLRLDLTSKRYPLYYEGDKPAKKTISVPAGKLWPLICGLASLIEYHSDTQELCFQSKVLGEFLNNEFFDDYISNFVNSIEVFGTTSAKNEYKNYKKTYAEEHNGKMPSPHSANKIWPSIKFTKGESGYRCLSAAWNYVDKKYSKFLRHR